MVEDLEDEFLDRLPSDYVLGCMECGCTFPVEELYKGGCPVCESPKIATFEDVLSYVIEHRDFMDQMGLGEDD